MLVLIFSLLSGYQGMMAGGVPDSGMSPGANQLFKESLGVGSIFEMLTTKQAEGAWIELGEQYVSVSKPIQAVRCFKKALVVDSKNEKAKKLLEASEARVKFLQERIETFEKKNNAPENYCSKAAILFHLGLVNDARLTLSEARKKFGKKQDVYYLARNFQQGSTDRRDLLKKVEKDLEQAIAGKDQKSATHLLGQILFLGLDPYLVSPQIRTYLTAFPNVNRKNLMDVAKTMNPSANVFLQNEG